MFGKMIEQIVLSPQFREIRGRDVSASRTRINGNRMRANYPPPSCRPSVKRTPFIGANMNQHHFSRRTFLHGLGVSMALPWMESARLGRRDELIQGRQPGANPIVRDLLRQWLSFEGMVGQGEGRNMEIGQVLQPLADFREKLVFVRGLYHEEARKGNIHSSQTGNMLSGAPIASGGEIRSGTSFDQVIAQTYGRSTKVPSLVLGLRDIEPVGP